MEQTAIISETAVIEQQPKENIKCELANKSKETKSGNFLFHIAQLFFYLIATNILLSAVIFAIGNTMSWYVLPLSLIISVIMLASFYGGQITKKLAIEVAVGIVLFAIFILFVGQLFDISYDGNNYHKLAVGLLEGGWNPLTQTPTVEMVAIGCQNAGGLLWAECYCKVTWIFASSIYAITNNIETGKVYTLLAMFMTFCITYYFLRKKGKKLYVCILLGLIASLNPIAIQQVTTFYIDGFLQLMLYCLLISLIMWYQKDIFDQKISLSLVACTLIIAANTKFTGLLFGAVFCLLYFGMYCIRLYRTDKKNFWRPAIKTCSTFAIFAVIAVVWAGSSTYVTNLLNHGSIGYPLTGSNPIDIMTANSPFKDVNHFTNLFLSLFSYMQNFAIASGADPILKMPFTCDSLLEAECLTHVDVRISGFGIFFSGILIISLITLIIKLCTMKKDGKFWFLLANILMFIGITFALTESWWARYAPCIYFLVIWATYFLLENKMCGKIVGKIMGIVFAVLIISNSNLFWENMTIQNGLGISQKLDYIKELNQPIYVHDLYFPGSYYNLKDRGIDFIVDENITEREGWQYVGYQGLKYAIRS